MAISDADLAAFHALQLAPQSQAAPKAKGNFLTHLFPTIGGTAGGIGGGALLGGELGTAILPGIGTAAGGLLGALAGGALGGGVGKVVENNTEGQHWSNGVAGQAIENGVLSAGPWRLAKMGGSLAKAGVEAGASRVVPSLSAALIKPVAADGAQLATAGEQAVAGGLGADAGSQVLKTSTAGKLESFGNNQLAKQWGTLDKPTIRATNPGATVGTLANMGIVKPLDAERVAAGVTGSDGILNQAVSKAVSTANPLVIDHLPATVDTAISKSGIVDTAAKGLKNEIQADLELVNPADPASAMKVMRNLEARQNEYLGKGGTYHLPTSLDKKRAAVIGQVKDELQNTLYNTAGANGNISSVMTPEVRQSLLDLHPNNSQWASHVDNIMNSKTVGDLRAAQAPFVNASKMIDNADSNSFSMGGKVGNMLNGGSGSVKSTLINSVANLAKDPVARAAGLTARKLSGAADTGVANGTKGLLGALSAPSTKQIVRNNVLGSSVLGMAHGGQSQLNDAQPTNGLMDTIDPNSVPSEIDPATGLPTGNTTSSLTAPQQQPTADPNDPFNPANISANVQNMIANGAKMSDVNSYLSMAQTMQKIQAAASPASKATAGYSKPSASQYSQGVSGMQSIGQLEQMLQQNPGVVAKNATPGQGLPLVGSLLSNAEGTAQYRALTHNILNSVARINTGANMPAEEESFYRNTYLPQPGDKPDVIATKMQNLQSFFQPIVQYPGGTGSVDPTDLLSALGGQ